MVFLRVFPFFLPLTVGNLGCLKGLFDRDSKKGMIVRPKGNDCGRHKASTHGKMGIPKSGETRETGCFARIVAKKGFLRK